MSVTTYLASLAAAKTNLATNLTDAGIDSVDTEPFADLVEKVNQIGEDDVWGEM